MLKWSEIVGHNRSEWVVTMARNTQQHAMGLQDFNNTGYGSMIGVAADVLRGLVPKGSVRGVKENSGREKGLL